MRSRCASIPTAQAEELPFEVALLVEDRPYRKVSLSLPLSILETELDAARFTRQFANQRRATFYNSSFVADFQLSISASKPFRVALEASQGVSHWAIIEFEQSTDDILIDVVASIGEIAFSVPEDWDVRTRRPVLREAYWGTTDGQVAAAEARITLPSDTVQSTFAHELIVDIHNTAEGTVHRGGGAVVYGVLARRVP